MVDAPGHAPPLRSFPYCPGCGAKGIAIRSDGSVGCKKCGYHFYFNVAAAVAGLIEDDIGRLLLTVRAHDPKKGALDLPGGFVDLEETAEEALAREIKEELNLKVKKCSYLASFPNTYTYDSVTYKTLDFAFVCTVESFRDQKPSEEIQDVLFIKSADIDLNSIGFDSIRNIVSLYLRIKKG
jgi:NADH pyrophosphatase NudC (nudix superfamily)